MLLCGTLKFVRLEYGTTFIPKHIRIFLSKIISSKIKKTTQLVYSDLHPKKIGKLGSVADFS